MISNSGVYGSGELTSHRQRAPAAGGFAIRTLAQHRYSERLVDHDIIASVGSKNDSFDSAMAEFNGLTNGR